MYLSRLILNPGSAQVISELSDPYQMHRTLMRAFPAEVEGGPGRVLFRAAQDKNYGEVTVLVQSEKQPDWSFLTKNNYLLDIKNTCNSACKPYDIQLQAGMRLRFLLRANPTARRVFQDGKPWKRVGLVNEEEQSQWLKRKGEQGGFRPDAFHIVSHGKIVSSRKGRETVHVCVEYSGILTVADAELFRETLETGIGSAKGFGFGLLSIAPV